MNCKSSSSNSSNSLLCRVLRRTALGPRTATTTNQIAHSLFSTLNGVFFGCLYTYIRKGEKKGAYIITLSAVG